MVICSLCVTKIMNYQLLELTGTTGIMFSHELHAPVIDMRRSTLTVRTLESGRIGTQDFSQLSIDAGNVSGHIHVTNNTGLILGGPSIASLGLEQGSSIRGNLTVTN